jgi:predicted dehydrogenase
MGGNVVLLPVLRIGVVGAGLIAWAHTLGLQAMSAAGTIDAAVTAVYDVDGVRAERFAEANATTAVDSVADVIGRSDAVYVCTPTAFHLAAVEAAAAAGVAVFCEKPLAPTLNESQQLAAAVDAAGVPAQVGLVLRSRPVFRALRDVLDSDDLGPPMAAAFRDDQYFPTQGLYPSAWRADVEIAGGGCLIEHSIHDLDILRYCLGEIADLSARTTNVFGHEGVEDVASVALRFASGATADLVSVWHNILRRGSTRRLEVFCQDGLVWLDDDFRGPLHIETSDGAEVRPCRSPDWVDDLPFGDDEVGLAISSYVEADRAFVDAVVEGRAPDPGLAEGVVAHRLVDAAYASAAMGGVLASLS